MSINTYPYPLGGINGQHRGSTTQASSGTTVGTGSGDLGTNTSVSTGGTGGITQSVSAGSGAAYTNQGASPSPVNMVSLGNPGWFLANTLGNVSHMTVVYPTPYPPPKDEGIKAGEITGYRAWHIFNLKDANNSYRAKLMSVFASHVWTPGLSEITNKDVDDILAGSGFHAFTTPELCLKEYGLGLITATGIVYGEIKMWGKVIEHERGYRSEYCKITKLSDILVYNMHDPELTLNNLCKDYGVERGQPWGTTSTNYHRGIVGPPLIVDSRTWTGLD